MAVLRLKQMAKLIDILANLDNDIRKRSYYDVCSLIASADKDEETSFEIEAEIMGMSIIENICQEKWECYSEIIPEHIEYWTRRASETKNPLLKMRYAGLVWEYGKKVTNGEPSYKDIKLAFIVSSIETVEQDLAEYTVNGIFYCKRAIEKAISIRNQGLTDRAIVALMAYQKHDDKDEHPGIWGRAFQIMTEHLKEFGPYEEEMVNSMLERFDRIEALCKAEGAKTDSHAHILKEAAELFAEYYKQKQQPEKIKEYLVRYHACLRVSYDLRGAMWAHGMLQVLQNLYRKYNLTKEANRLYVEIQALGGKALTEMEHVEFSAPIDNKLIEEYFEPLLTGSGREILMKYMVKYMPNIEYEQQQQRIEAQQSPMMDMIRTVAYNQAGMPINNIGVGERAEEQKLSHGMYRRMMITAVFMEMHIKRMEDKGVYTYESVMDLFKDSDLIVDAQRPLLGKGVKAYFDKDYIVACSILVPLFEAAIRNLAASTGHEVLRASGEPEEGNEYVSLEKLLGVLEQDDAEHKDVYVYFRHLFTDKYGWNTRNLLCHGALAANAFNNTLANRIMHAFLLLSQIRLVERE